VNICLDFDGVLHDHSQTVFPKMGKPVEGARDAVLALLAAGHKLVISTCRLGASDRHAVDTEGEMAWTHVHDWLRYFDFPYIPVTYEKPIAHLYIDDRGCRFEGDWRSTLMVVNDYAQLERVRQTEDPIEQGKRR
jgi:hypothetical protein